MKKDEARLYLITEIGRGIYERYALKMLPSELSRYLKQKRAANGYIQGVGGDRSYDCFAIEL